MDLEGRVAVVTGGGKGIGAGVSRALAAAGARVVVNYLADRDTAERTVADCEAAGGQAMAVAADVADPDDVRRLLDRARTVFGPVDTLVNNAATYSYQFLEELTPAEIERQYRTNVFGVFLTCQALVRQMPGSGGSIVNITTADLNHHAPRSALYTSTKGAVTTLTKTLANELGPRRIRVNAVAPGATDTEGARALGLLTEDGVASVSAMTPLGRVGRPEDVGAVVAFLCSPAAGWVTGEVVFASGGLWV